MNVTDKKLEMLTNEIEKVRRRKIVDFQSSDTVEFIDPYGNLDKIKISNNHLVLARRGCGKTTLMLKSLQLIENSICSIVDCQPIKTKSSSKAILHISDELLTNILKYYETESWQSRNKEMVNIFKRFGLKKNDPELYERNLNLIDLKKIVNNLLDNIKVLSESDEKIKYSKRTNIETKKEKSKEINAKAMIKLNSKVNIPVLESLMSNNIEVTGIVEGSVQNKYRSSESTEIEMQNEVELRLIDILNDKIKKNLKDIFQIFFNSSGQKIVLYLDDFYLFEQKVQPEIIQFLHDIYKITYDSAFCFKISALPYRIKANEDDSYDFSYKDDFSKISLDVDLSEIDNLSDHLILIVCNLDKNIGLMPNDIKSIFNNNSVLEYAVIAAGGIPRDFMLVLSDLIACAKSENRNQITKENVYTIIKQLKEDKEQNIEYDTDLEVSVIREALSQLENDFLNKEKTNIFLYPKDKAKNHEVLLRNLSNLRYIHLIKEGISSENRKGKIFDAYLVDMTFYATGKRMKRDFTFREFWEKDSKQRLPHLHRSPIWNFNIDI